MEPFRAAVFLFLLTAGSVTHLEARLFDCVQYRHCQCTEQAISCVRSGIHRVPIFSPFLVSLNLSHNALLAIEPTALRHLSLLETLDLSHNQVTNLTKFTFSGLANLRTLHLHHNQIDLIQRDAFKNLHELRELRLEGNPLMQLDGDVFYDLHKLDRLTVAVWQRNGNSTVLTGDDRARLCHCQDVRLMWRVKENFVFCQKVTFAGPVRNRQCRTLEVDRVESTGSTIEKEANVQQGIVQLDEIASGTTTQGIVSQSAPMLTRVPDSLVRANAGSSVEWKCEASGHPTPVLKWYRRRQVISNNTTLTLLSLKPEDEGSYECAASNSEGVAAREVTLYVVGGLKQDEHYHRLKEIVNATAKTSNGTAATLAREKETMLSSTSQIDSFVELVRSILRQSDDGATFPSGHKAQSDWLTPVQQLTLLNYTGCVGGSQVQVLDCQQFIRYRSATSICNNLKHGLWGSQMTPFVRLLPARYEDGLAKPVGWFMERKYGEYHLPNAKLITRTLLSTSKLTPDPRHNHMLMQFGQFLSHDITFAAASRSWNILEDSLIDCRKTCRYVEPCFSVSRQWNSSSNSEQAARRRHQSNCIEVVRSAELCGSGFTSVVHGSLAPREQVNQLTAYIDGSNIYGSTPELARYLRDLNSNTGLLKTSLVNGESYLPLSDEHFPIDCQLQPRAGFMDCFLAGDHRANEQIGLLVFHNLWLRQHNRLAAQLRVLRPNWSGEQIYQETRKIVEAQLQIITYRDWLPLVIGKEGMSHLGKYRGYNESVDASISNVFATAAMRFGHTLVNTHLVRQFVTNSTQLRKVFFASHLLYRENLTSAVLEGLLSMPLKKPMPEQAINSELTEHLFEQSREAPLDLASINIQRGRDHALPGYNEWRAFCGLGKANSFDDLAAEIGNIDIRRKLKQLYGDPNNIDIWVGGIMEDAVHDGKVGPTFRCLLVEQFRKLRDGDRYFYKAANMFTDDQRAELEKVQLSKIICSNEKLAKVPKNAFVLSEHQTPVSCDSDLDDVDLTKW